VIESASRPVVERVSRWPRWTLPALTILVVLVGLVLPKPYCFVAFGVLLAYLMWVSYLAWPALPIRERAARFVVPGAVVLLIIARI
jgi:hypothetical protein